MTVITGIVQSAIAQRLTHERVIIAVSGPQGSGKTTSAAKASRILTLQHNIPSIALSIDDFYLPHAELCELAHCGNVLLRKRGLPGTHDVPLMIQFFTDFVNKKSGLKAPQFDKSLFQGEGDRGNYLDVPEDTQVIIFEGWMLGFFPQTSDVIARKMPQIENLSLHPSVKDITQINNKLTDYIPIWKFINAMIKIEPENMDYVYTWRTQQEHDLIKVKGTGMTDEQVKLFIDQFFSCYILYNQSFSSAGYPIIVSRIDINHNPI